MIPLHGNIFEVEAILYQTPRFHLNTQLSDGANLILITIPLICMMNLDRRWSC